MAETDDQVAAIISTAGVRRLPAAKRLIAAARNQDPAVVVVAGGLAVPDEPTARSLGADG